MFLDIKEKITHRRNKEKGYRVQKTNTMEEKRENVKINNKSSLRLKIINIINNCMKNTST